MSHPSRDLPGEAHLQATTCIDAGHPDVQDFAADTVRGVANPRERAVALYYRVRDEFRYQPYRISLEPEHMKASSTLERGEGFCVPKAVLLAAAARAAGVPARLGFADVKNHLATEKLLDVLGTDIFIYHGYTELHIDGAWVKATPAFNVALCEKFGVKPLEFDGTEDSVFHEFDVAGNRHMEYVTDHGPFDDLPLDLLEREYRAFYPNWAQLLDQGDSPNAAGIEGEFGADAEAERRSRAGEPAA